MQQGPGYRSPLDAMKGPREELLYVICIQTNPNPTKSDLLATVDVNPSSPTYSKIIHKTYTERLHDELHHSGWNVCSSCYKVKECCPVPVRNRLVMPSLGSNRVYIVDTETDPRKPKIHKVIEASEIDALNCSALHTSHCLPSGEVMISAMGDANGNGKCDFVLIDACTLKPKGTWIQGNKRPQFNYDFWYQPYHDILVSTEWGIPNVFKKGMKPGDADNYGKSLNFFSYKDRELLQSIDLGKEGTAPLEIRFLHNPKASEGFVGCAVYSKVFRFYLAGDGKWKAEKVIDIPPKKTSNGEFIHGLTSDILISLDDRFLYINNWIHGDIRQYDITDTKNPRLVGQLFLGGKLTKDAKDKVVEDPEGKAPVDPVYVKGRRLLGGPQMMQLSLDGKRLYVSSGLFSPWDRQFYPETIKTGSFLVKVDVNTVTGGLKLDDDFLVDFGEDPSEPLYAHEIRYPGGDCTSDIWLADD
ncbi:methanethiol oxidase [Agrilus planipennis]|uniref:Methanethiol oxidase n=1 Tax=Agrilus planipennis TaxID=224129 RepID=A0A1W4X823_AGRPL|nr:methanethiol oxidase [Agrilus planipennis]